MTQSERLSTQPTEEDDLDRLPAPQAWSSPEVPARSTVTVFLIVSVRLFREGLARELSTSRWINVVGLASSPSQGRAELIRTSPDIVLLDAPAPERSQAVRSIVQALPRTRVVALGMREAEDEDEIVALAAAGAAGYVTDQATLHHLRAAIAGAAGGELHCAPRISALLFRQVGRRTQRAKGIAGDSGVLTDRESEVLGLIASGLTNREISRTLEISLSTVKNHVHSILGKLHAGSRSEALARVRGN